MQHSRWTLLASALLWAACLASYCMQPYPSAMPHANALAQGSQRQVYLPLVANPHAIIVAASLQAAADAAKPGDTLMLRGGVYTGDLKIRRAGSADAPITLVGAGTGQTIIHGGVRVNGAAAFWRIQNLPSRKNQRNPCHDKPQRPDNVTDGVDSSGRLPASGF